jgi:apolipoprotein D and lipocalin family protein
MKNLLLICLIFITVKASSISPVAYASVEKFSGLWYEIARSYNSYQESCVASSVEYVLEDDNEYKVFNRCFKDKIGGELIEYKGTARPSIGDNISKLKMTYFWIFTKEYAIYYIDDNYTSALVADKDFEQIWIMSRTPFMQKNRLQKIEKMLATQIDLSTLIYTPQDKKGRYK